MQPQTTPLNRDLDSLYHHVDQIEDVLRTGVEFGNPAHPTDPANVALAGSTAGEHNGSPDNILGSWVEVEVTAPGVPFACYHNLGLAPIAGQLNVRWPVCNFMHDGTGADAASTLSVNYQAGDLVAVDSLELRLYVGGTRTVDEDHPVKITFFFSPAVRG